MGLRANKYRQRKLKRHTTSQALDLLNNVNKPRSTKIDNTPVTRSDTVWDVPNSDEDDRFTPSKRVALSDPITSPRRSARLAKPRGELSPTRTSRTTRGARVELSERDEEEESDQESEYESGQESVQESDAGSDKDSDEEPAGPSEDDEEGGYDESNDPDTQEDQQRDAFPQFLLLSDSHESPHSNKSNRLSPFEIQGQRPALRSETTGRSDEAGDESNNKSQDGSESEYGTPEEDRSPQQADESHSGLDTSQSAQEPSKSSPVVVVANVRSSVVGEDSAVHSSASSSRNTRSEDLSRPSEVRAESIDSDGDVEPSHAELESNGDDPPDIPVEEESPAYSPSEPEDSRRDRPPGPGLFRHSVDLEERPCTPPSKRRRTSNHQRVSQTGGQRRRRSIVTSQDVSPMDPPGNQNELRRPDRDLHGREQREIDSSDDESVSDQEEEGWLDRALKLGGQKANWDAVVDEARMLKEVARPPIAEFFSEFQALTSDLQDRYADIVDYLNAERRPRRATMRECDDFLDAILAQGHSFLDYACNHHQEEEISELVDEFEAHLVSGMADVMLPCFEAYCKDGGYFPKAYHHLHRVLDVFLRLCRRIYSMVKEGYVESKSRGHSLLRPLQKLLMALEEDWFKQGAPPPAPQRGLSIKHGKKWSEDEGSALLDGLQLYQDRDRYARILKHFQDKLRGRTIRSVREKAQQLHDKLLSSMIEPDELETEEGRQRWHWLLSVRQDES
ncbi:hypothetical protein BDV28DRAFT_127074 [Aspergillus coremiiformis]|uniref:Myb-like domain-containing protein n=1 Tax=Aspergillus coremiiformis TaxID=138285 RepID=A0A5N6ZFN7_9EURO|nr:hypothetical protein BDV28DRAFT_127074 [Aspergillus coremiiformis]